MLLDMIFNFMTFSLAFSFFVGKILERSMEFLNSLYHA